MSFILVLKAEQGTVTLLSDVAYGSRKEALGALSEITAEPVFESWEDDVLVVDLDQGTPVLLVRPAAATAITDAVEPESSEVAAASESDEGLLSPSVDAVEDDGAEVESEVESETQSEETEETESIVVETVPMDSAPAFDESDDLGEGDGSLKDALTRTAAQMEADGITAPESVGPADDDEPVTDTDTGPDTGDSSDAEAASEPEAETAAAEESWPWATKETAESEQEFSLSALEEPGEDGGGSLVYAAGDDDTMSASRPVILGDYDDAPAVEPMSLHDTEAGSVQVTDDEEIDDSLASSLAAALADTGEIAGEPTDASDSDQPSQNSSDVISDFILDMAPTVGTGGVLAEESVQAEPSGYQVAPDAPQMSCSDCVYVNTCPNKGEREPASCGSFQWK